MDYIQNITSNTSLWLLILCCRNIFTLLLPSSARLFLLNCSGFQPSCHSILIDVNLNITPNSWGLKFHPSSCTLYSCGCSEFILILDMLSLKDNYTRIVYVHLAWNFPMVCVDLGSLFINNMGFFSHILHSSSQAYTV
jgi:hypothetical protein